ncbi:F208B protein, partial [Brachypteracias leptosomus]|nr:F208B protein [Brachypteracias leptosomus]
PWRGQLSIQGHLLCNIALRTPHSSTIPAQLSFSCSSPHSCSRPFPSPYFTITSSLLSAVCFQGVYFSLYEVEISNKDQYRMDQLIENLKEKDLAIIKYLQDQGALLLLTSSAL